MNITQIPPFSLYCISELLPVSNSALVTLSQPEGRMAETPKLSYKKQELNLNS